MDETDIRLKLIEAASELPGVRAGVDPVDQAERAREVASVWYTYVMGTVAPTARKRRTR